MRLTDHPLVIVNYFRYSIGLVALEILFFQEIPDLLSISGAFLIIISGYLNYKLNLKLKQKEEIDLL